MFTIKYYPPEACELELDLSGLLCESPYDSDLELVDLDGPEL